MAAIDVGPGATDRGDTLSSYTLVDKANPANADGTIDHLEIWMALSSSGIVDFGSFYVETGTNLSTRGVAQGMTLATGDNEFDAPGDFTAFSIASGDYLGTYFSAGNIDTEHSGGSGVLYCAGNNIPASDVEFSLLPSWIVSIYGTGLESVAGYPPQIYFFG